VYKVLWLLGISVLALLAVGLLVLASAGGVNGIRLFKDPYHFLFRQAAWLVVSLVGLFLAAKFDYHRWREYPWMTVLLYVGVVLLMGAVFLYPEVKGSRRWIGHGSIRFQPSEFAKLTVVIATAVFIDRAGWRIEKFWKGAVRAVLVVAVLMGLAVAEPDFGATLVIGLAGGVLLLISGMRFLHLLAMGAVGLCGVGTLLAFNRNRMNRILAWLPQSFAEAFGIPPDVAAANAERDASHQLNQALIAIRRGGVTGVGFNQSMQKNQYLPEAHTDFIFAIGAEEWGLVFSLILLALFITFFVCGVLIALNAPDRLGRLIAYGMTFLVFFQALFNIGVVTGCLPTKGIALPFVSYGGTNLVTAMVAVGVLFNVGRQIGLQSVRPKSRISRVFQPQGV